MAKMLAQMPALSPTSIKDVDVPNFGEAMDSI